MGKQNGQISRSGEIGYWIVGEEVDSEFYSLAHRKSFHVRHNVLTQKWDTQIKPIIDRSEFEYPCDGIEVHTELFADLETDEIFEKIFDSGPLEGSAVICICGAWFLSRRAIELVGLYYDYPPCCAKAYAWDDWHARNVWDKYGADLIDVGHVPCKSCCERLSYRAERCLKSHLKPTSRS